MSETLKVNGLCRCCLTEGEFRSLGAPYRSDGSDSSSSSVLLRETLNITINPMPGPENAPTYTICDGCTSRLQDAAQFRNQVLECETKFTAYVENYLRGDCSFIAETIQIEAETLQDEEIEHMKEEIENFNAMSPDEGHNYINEFDSKIEVCDDDNSIGDARYPCDISNEIFCRKDKLRSHVPDNHIRSQDSRDLSGLSCDRTFNKRRAEYHCAFCTDTFPKLKSLKSHELTHTEKTGFICDYCQASFNLKQKLKKHMYYHKGSSTGKHSCEICGKIMKTASSLKRHIINVHGKIRAFKCDLCPKTYQLKWRLKEHKSIHTGEFSYKCDVCFKSYRFQSNLKTHKRRHLLKTIKQDQPRIGTESWPDNLNKKCQICGKCFKYKSLLIKHLNTHTKPLQCDVCGKSFSNKTLMAKHQKQHDPGERETKTERKNCSGPDEEEIDINQFDSKLDVCDDGNRIGDARYPCDISNEILRRKDKLRSHVLDNHICSQDSRDSGLSCDRTFNRYHCAFCTETFPKWKSLKSHELAHTEKSGLICDYCQKSFSDKIKLRNHIIYHTGNYTCEICGHFTKKASDLKVHIRSVHEKIKTFKCNLCPKTYKAKRQLIEHRSVHTGVFPYKCDVCFKKIRFQSSFIRHKKRHLLKSIKPDQARIGTESRPDNLNNKCQFCGKCFKYKSLLIKHLNTHTKPLQCDVCGKSFSNKTLMVQHQKQHDLGERETKTERKNCSGPDEGENYINQFDSKIDVCDDGNRIGDARYPCDISNEILRRNNKLRSHVLDNHICSQDSRDFSGLSCVRTFNKYHCAFCTETFPKWKSLKSHELAHTEKSGLICDYCQKSFSDKIKLRNHIIYHTGNYTCEICGHFTKKASDLKVHIRSVHEKIRAFKCNLCPKTYKAKRQLIEHRSVHTGVFPYKCDVCFKKIRFQSSFIRHKKRHLLKSIKPDQARIGTESRADNLNNKCQFCGKFFKYKSLLIKHLNTHTKPLQCDVCGKSFSNKTLMVQHQKQHDAGERETKTEKKNCSGNQIGDARYPCDISNEILRRKDKLRSHVLDNHICSQDSRDFSDLSCDRTFNKYHCAFCTETFPKWKSLKSHELAHTEKSGLICDYCQKSFSDKIKLKDHIIYHTGNYTCEICGHFTKQASDLKVHIRSVHEKIRAFKCDLCPKTYMAKRLLKEHRSVHTGVFLHKCDVCFKKFRFQASFIRHKNRHLLKSIKPDQARICTESRPDNLNKKCPTCGKNFKYKSLLTKHLNTHTKRFQCDVCRKSFSNKLSRAQHQKQHDPGERKNTN